MPIKPKTDSEDVKLPLFWNAFLKNATPIPDPVKIESPKAESAPERKKRLNGEFATAVLSSNYAKMIECLESGVDPNLRLPTGKRPLPYFVSMGDVEGLKALSVAKERLRIPRGISRGDPLWTAMNMERIDLVTTLLELGFKETPMRKWRGMGAATMLGYILRYSTQEAKSCQFALDWLKVHGIESCVDLLKGLQDNNEALELTQALVHIAARGKNSELMKKARLWIGQQGTVKVVDETMRQAWFMGIQNDRPETLLFLLEHGVVPRSRKQIPGHAPTIGLFWHVVPCNARRCCDWLLNNSAMVELIKKDMQDSPSAVIAEIQRCAASNADLLEKIDQVVPLINLRSSEGDTLAHVLSDLNKAWVDVIVKNGWGAWLETKNENGKTPFDLPDTDYRKERYAKVAAYFEKKVLKKEVRSMQSTGQTVVHRPSRQRL